MVSVSLDTALDCESRDDVDGATLEVKVGARKVMERTGVNSADMMDDE